MISRIMNLSVAVQYEFSLLFTGAGQDSFGKAAERKKRAREDEVKKKVEEVLERAKQVSFSHSSLNKS